MEHSLDPMKSVLVGQVRKAEASHCMDTSTNLLRGRHFRGQKTTVYLGDVAQATLSHLLHPETPCFTDPPGYNEQRWTLETQSGGLKVQIESKPYWGWGLVTSGYLNVITLEGSLEDRSRLVLDVVSSLGQSPWEMSHHRSAGRFLNRRGGLSVKGNESEWKALLSNAKATLSERIQELVERRDEATLQQEGNEGAEGWLKAVEEDIHMAKQALAEDNAPGVERALARIEASLIHLDAASQETMIVKAPGDRFTVDGFGTEEVGSMNPPEDAVASLLLSDEEVPFVDLATKPTEEE